MKARVLVVDDSPDTLHVLKRMLSHRGYRVEVAADGETALQKYRAFKPDIVTLDLGMSGMNGYETLEKILEIDKDARVVIVTASPYATFEECLNAGAAGLIKKPFASDKLVGTIEQILGRMKTGHSITS